MSQITPPTDSDPRFNATPLLVSILIWGLIVWCALTMYHPVDPVTENVPDSQFSAARAESTLELLVGDSIPHPSDSPQNAVVRSRIVMLFNLYGYQVEIQSGEMDINQRVKHRSPDKDRVNVHNIIARRADGGETTGKAIMLVAHYDSVNTGPGASDDGVGTAAVLEIARMLANEPAPSREVIFLITDGEELGLLGAKMFVEQNPLAARVGLVINLEARGTTGPSMMFETSRQSRELIPLFARASRRPYTSSLFYEIYKRLPNDTDFSVFNRDGMLGYNFAFIGDVKNYHTTADNFDNVDRGSLQHHGENANRLVRVLMDSDEVQPILDNRVSAIQSSPLQTEAVYFDFFGRWVVWWPGLWSIWFSVGSLVLLGLAVKGWETVGRNRGAGTMSIGLVGKHLLAHVAVIVSIFAAGYLIQFLIRQAPQLGNPWPLSPFPILCGYWTAALALSGCVAMLMHRWLQPQLTWLGWAVLWSLLAMGSSALVNGASYLFLVPLIAGVAVALVGCWAGNRGTIVTAVATAVVVGLIWLPLEPLFYDAVGFKMPIAMLFRMSVVATAVLNLLAFCSSRVKFGFSLLMATLSVLAFVAAFFANTEAGV